MDDCSVRREELETVNKTIDTYLAIFGNRWNLLILYELFNGPKRFNELKRSLEPISQTVLVRHLKVLLAYGVIERKELKGAVIGVIYCLSEVGYRATPAMISTYGWINELKDKM